MTSALKPGLSRLSSDDSRNYLLINLLTLYYIRTGFLGVIGLDRYRQHSVETSVMSVRHLQDFRIAPEVLTGCKIPQIAVTMAQPGTLPAVFFHGACRPGRVCSLVQVGRQALPFPNAILVTGLRLYTYTNLCQTCCQCPWGPAVSFGQILSSEARGLIVIR